MIKLDKKPKAVIFDFDNTLVDSLKYWYLIIDKLSFLEYNQKPNKNFPLLRKGLSNYDIVKTFIAIANIDVSVEELVKNADNKMEYYYKNKVELLGGVRKFLNYLKNNGYKLYVASATNYDLLNKALEYVNIKNYFDEIISESEVKLTKKDEKFFPLLLQKLKLNSEDVFFFEDSKGSIQNAINRGINCGALLNKYNKEHKNYFENECKIVIKKYNLRQLIKMGF